MGEKPIDDHFRWGKRWGSFYEEARRVGLSDAQAIDWADAQFRRRPSSPQPTLFSEDKDVRPDDARP